MEAMSWAEDKKSAAEGENRKVLVEERSEDMKGAKILWDIIPTSNGSTSVEERPS